MIPAGVTTDATPEAKNTTTVLTARDLDVFYGDERALRSISVEIPETQATATIGPSGCGKSTFLRCINRMNDQIASARVEGELFFHGKNVYDEDVDPVATSQIEDLIEDIAQEFTVVIVTHNMQQAARISHKTAVFLTGGELVEFDDTATIFESPESQRVEDNTTGKFG
ncbi:phosphate ABC transporter ATP-binding protein [Haloferacaceae archaeon DSL9]